MFQNFQWFTSSIAEIWQKGITKQNCSIGGSRVAGSKKKEKVRNKSFKDTPKSDILPPVRVYLIATLLAINSSMN